MPQLPNFGPIGELAVSEWIGTPPAPTMAELRGQVVAIEAFQMLCPGCVTHGLPQAARLQRDFGQDIVVFGLHTVFEHHAVMGVEALRVFLAEFRTPFPVAVDEPRGVGLPVTMQRLGLQGTPTLLLVDRNGDIRFRGLGTVEDIALGVAVGTLIGS
ncbi:hypothetical protein BJY21_001258 [Kineosphaera limosa]|uniref:Putative thiol-disulfide oxidoreductase n=1 Tax=Kineosphaera limosa NBRC 100340 TaxID=1184609 RepID=K6WUI3_9MICO|nr:TlpA disulfide reductase family protein [Kineosphaera limosa]NYE00074.1 hypothetical protein [Kineosphaera limosa]GAB95752.1 putative thiol-disulfide oxidoreductase [Kineosphaera limosa NBRC 100340]